MEDIEIYLNRLAGQTEIYAGLAAKLACREITDKASLEAHLADRSGAISCRIYVSDEKSENPAVSDVLDAFIRSRVRYEIINDEFLNLIDSEAHLTAEAKPRSLVHRDGDLHPAVHIWIIRRRDMGIYVLLQKRSHEKEISPDCYDVSAAGHVSQGEEFRSTAVRETAEELGLAIHGSKLELIGLHESRSSDGKTNDNELRAVYLCREDVDLDQLTLQASEVSDVCWAEIDELLAVMDDGSFKHCIDLDELAMIKKAVF